MEQLQPIILEIVALVVGGFVTVAAAYVTRKTGIDISEARRRTIESALITGATRLIEGKPELMFSDAKGELIDAAMDWAKGPGAGDSLRKAGWSDDVLRVKAQAATAIVKTRAVQSDLADMVGEL